MCRTIGSVIFVCLLISLNETAVAKTEILSIDESNWKECAPSGKEVDWIYGDYVLRNEHIVAVIAKPGPTRDANMTTRDVSGCLIDFTSREHSNDQLSAYYPGGRLFEFSKDATARPVSRGDDSNGVVLTFTGTPIPNYPHLSGLKHVVAYQLDDDAELLRIESRITNTSDKPIRLALFDLLRADRDFKMKTNESLNSFVASDYWWNQAYVVTGLGHRLVYKKQKRSHLLYFRSLDTSDVATPAEAGSVRADSETDGETDEAESPQVMIAPGKSVTYVRTIGSGRHSAEVLGLVSDDHGELQISVADDDGPVSGAKIAFQQGDDDFALARTDKQGISRFRMAAGEFTAKVSALGRDDRTFDLVVGPDEFVQEKITMERPAYVSATITDEEGEPIACKVAFDSIIEDGDPYFGPDTYVWEVHNLIYTEDGVFRHAIPSGTFNVIISHGNEYDAVTQQITATKGEETKITATLKRTVDTTGWVSADFHSHSSPSGDNTSSQLGRVLNLLAEQIEFAPCTEHNRVSTYVPHLRRLAALDRMATCPGIELTGGPLPVNHQNAFPLHHHPHTQDGGGGPAARGPGTQKKKQSQWGTAHHKKKKEKKTKNNPKK
jgi:hypothetical protein